MTAVPARARRQGVLLRSRSDSETSTAPRGAAIRAARPAWARRRTRPWASCAVSRCTPPGRLRLADDPRPLRRHRRQRERFRCRGTPAPRNNAGMPGAIPPSTCGNGAVQSLEQCDDGNVAVGDGCNGSCGREAERVHAPGAGRGSRRERDLGRQRRLRARGAGAMRPSWRNAATRSPGPHRGAVAFAGPAGPTYAMVDGTAGYGTLAPAAPRAAPPPATATRCACPNPPPRPVTHWDATAAEVNVNYGFKTWSVHVGESFTDVPRSNPFYRFIETLLHRGVTGGCTATTYCPGGATTREAMAVFVLVARDPADQPARLRRARVQRRARVEPVLPLDRGAGAPRRGRRMRRRQLLPQRRRSRARPWRSSCCARSIPRSTRPPAARRCSPTCRRRARSAAGSRSWPAAAWSAGAAAGTTARRRR